MKLSILLATGLSICTVSATDDISSVLNELPKCSISCIATGLSSSGCLVTDLDCLCSKLEGLIADTSPCLVKAGCTFNEVTRVGESVVNVCEGHMGNSTAKTTDTSAAPKGGLYGGQWLLAWAITALWVQNVIQY